MIDADTLSSRRRPGLVALGTILFAGALGVDDVRADDPAGAGDSTPLHVLSMMHGDAPPDDKLHVGKGAALPTFTPAFALQGSRWTATATDGTVGAGAAFTLTYSFVPDGTSILIASQGASASNLFATLDANFPGGRAVWKARFAEALAKWSDYTNITYVEVTDDGAAFPSSAGELGSRGDVRIAMVPQGDANYGVNYFPQFGGDMVLNSDRIAEFVVPGPEDEFRGFINTIARQHGHGLGLSTIVSDLDDFLMESDLNLAFLGPQEDDIRGVQSLYGDRYEPNDAAGTESFVGGPLRDPATSGNTTITVDNVALSGTDDSDRYAFTAFAGAPIAIRVEPVGFAYSFADANTPQTVATVDSRAVRNLALRLWRRTSAQDNTFGLVAQINFNGAGEGEYHPPIPYTLAGYMVAEVYSNDDADDVQRYRLRISNEAIDAAQARITITNGESIEDGQSYSALIAQTNVGETNTIVLSIRNQGDATLDLTGTPDAVTISGPAAADYATTLSRTNVPAGLDVAAELAITFAPTTAGVRGATFTIATNDPNHPDFSFTLIAQAVEPTVPEIEVQIDDGVIANDGAFDFGAVDVGDTKTVSFRVRNTGTASLSVTSLSFTNASEWSISLGSATLSPGAFASSALSFTPSAEGARDTTLNIASNATPSPFVIHLTGTGQAADNNNNNNDNNGCGGGLVSMAPLMMTGLFFLRMRTPARVRRRMRTKARHV